MRLESIRLRGFGPFKDEVWLDLSNTSGIVAVCGVNGAGKSTLLELWGSGSLYRSTPTRGSLTALATSREAFLEARLVNGKAWTVRHSVDCVNAKGESVVFGEAGRPAFESSKVKAFDRFSLDHFPPEEVLFSTVFQPQGSAGFLGLTRGERMAVILRVLGCERYERMAKGARDNASAERHKLETLQARLADETARGANIDHAQADLEGCRKSRESADAEVARARQELADAQAAAATAAEARRAYDSALRTRAELTTKIAAADKQIADLKERIANNRAIQADAKAIRAAVEQVAKLEADLAALEKATALDEQRRQAVVREAEGHKRTADAAKGRAAEARARADRLRKRYEERGKANEAAEALPVAARDALAADALVVSREQELEEVRSQRVDGAEARIAALRDGLDEIVDLRGENALALASSTLESDDGRVERARTLPKATVLAESALRDARDRAAIAARRKADLERLADTLAAFGQIETELMAATRQGDEAAAEASLARAAETTARTDAADLARRVSGHRDSATRLQEQLGQLRPAARRAEPLAHAEARLAELEPQLATVQRERTGLADQLSATPEPEHLPPSAPDVAALSGALSRTEDAARLAHSAVAIAERELEKAEASAARQAELDVERIACEAELADWNRLAADLGRDGLQAVEIDAAGPELTELANDLLRNCHGSRFTIRVDTQRLSSDKRLLEACDVMVLDSVGGREAEGSTFSGGEKVIIGEALSLALSMLACRRAGLEGVTLVRDESAAALDPANVRAYVAMLRRAQQIVGAKNVLFVCHSPEAQDLADARITIANGSVELS